MSVNVSTAFVQQYSTNVQMLLQQQGSRLRNAVQNYSFVGKAASMCEQFGQVSPVRNQSRHSDTPLISTPQDKRWVYPNDYDWADLIDNQDKLRMLVDPAGPYAMAGAWAMGRAIDDEIISGFFNSNNTRRNVAHELRIYLLPRKSSDAGHLQDRYDRARTGPALP